MDARGIALDIDAPIGPDRFEDLARMLGELGYEARRAGPAGPPDRPGPGGMTLTIRATEPIEPSRADSLRQAVAAWIGRRTQRAGRFRRWRRRAARPITIVILGPGGDVISRGLVERG